MVRALIPPRRRCLASRVVPPAPAVALTLLLAACGGGAPVRDVFFSLDAQPAVTPAARTIPGTLRVSPFAARGFVGGSRIVYRTAEQPLQVQRYNEFLWEQVPAQAIADDLLAALRAARVFENVATAGDPARADYLLTGELTRFEHHPTDRPPGVVAELSLALVDARSRELLVSKTYSGFEPTVTGAGGRTTPEAMIAAFNRLTGRLIGEVIADAGRLGASRR